jgi:hypothetical protein
MNPNQKNREDREKAALAPLRMPKRTHGTDTKPKRYGRFRYIGDGHVSGGHGLNSAKPDFQGAFDLDRDLVNFMRAAGIPNDETLYHAGTPQETTGAELWEAVSELIIDLKVSGIWETSVAIYPYVGGTGDSHKVNLKSPYNLNSSKRLVFHGEWRHSPTGATPLGAHSHADTFLRLSDDLPQYSFTGATCLRGNIIPVNSEFYPFGTIGSQTGIGDVSLSVNAKGECKAAAGTSTLTFKGFETTETFSGLLTMTCFRDNELRLYRNDRLLASSDSPRNFYFDNARPMDSAATLYLGKGGIRGLSRFNVVQPVERSFDCFGWGMDAKSQLALNDAVASFQAALHRCV